MENEGKTGISVDFEKLVGFMKQEKVFRVKTANMEIEMFPTAFLNESSKEDAPTHEDKVELTRDEKIALAKKHFNEMVGGI